MEVPTESIEQRRKMAIIDEYHILCMQIVPFLRSMINTMQPGNMYAVFYEFKSHFDSLFLLTSNKKGLKDDIVNPVKEWIQKEHKNPEEKDMKIGIELFEKYKAELFRMEVL